VRNSLRLRWWRFAVAGDDESELADDVGGIVAGPVVELSDVTWCT
jgi:hypothetical protein